MTSDDTPWEQPNPFTQAPEPEAPAPRQRRKKAADKPARQPRKAKEPAAEKPREKAERAPAETIKVTLKEFAIMRVGEENAKAFLKAHALLGELSKGARGKILSELAKVLG